MELSSGILGEFLDGLLVEEWGIISKIYKIPYSSAFEMFYVRHL